MATDSRADSAPDDLRDGLSVANGGPRRERVRVVQARQDTVCEAMLTLEPGEAASLSVPTGNGTVQVQLYAPSTVATTSFDPETESAFVTISGGSVLVGPL